MFVFQVDGIPSVETSQLLLGAITANGKAVEDKDKKKDKDRDKDKDKGNGKDNENVLLQLILNAIIANGENSKQEKKDNNQENEQINKKLNGLESNENEQERQLQKTSNVNNKDNTGEDKVKDENNIGEIEEQNDEETHKDNNDKTKVCLTSHLAAVEAKKLISRYCLLSWTLCCTTFSLPLQHQFGSPEQLVEKGLLRQRELEALQVPNFCKNIFKIYARQITSTCVIFGGFRSPGPSP